MIKKKSKAILIYNESCPFCRDIAHSLLKFIGHDKLSILSNTDNKILKMYPGITMEKVKKDVHLIVCNGNKCIYSSGEAIVNVLALNEKLQFLKKLYQIRPFNSIIEISYLILKKVKRYLNYLYD